MADDIPQDQTQTQDTPTVPLTDQPPVESPSEQPTPEQLVNSTANPND
jgi:hypothetical protein